MSEDTTNSGKQKQQDKVDSGNIVNNKQKSKDLSTTSHPVLIESIDDEDTSVQEMDSESDKSKDKELK
ncbi:uncharacterized protein FOMMEDRAFT_16595 [Fomitiporia mediterranea MF3/22]|uniref:uncharacterized protein n=1 Tax=Fomitiporia mediterranea (strain MF3/22) TaxID=694068 RepID=UPI0004408EDC|nr:uncharacterized protein FOMMEDRAFT_16595 [Fomitiporia mediterranea MF3/22]EJD08108.1 hypothetical protein FOMMEDRAFT_16595 [Fomitiporia mediterranea MF3/22]